MDKQTEMISSLFVWGRFDLQALYTSRQKKIHLACVLGQFLWETASSRSSSLSFFHLPMFPPPPRHFFLLFRRLFTLLSFGTVVTLFHSSPASSLILSFPLMFPSLPPFSHLPLLLFFLFWLFFPLRNYFLIFSATCFFLHFSSYYTFSLSSLASLISFNPSTFSSISWPTQLHPHGCKGGSQPVLL